MCVCDDVFLEFVGMSIWSQCQV